ncbi:MAG: AAA family ATPase, partial [Candidatus Dormibacteraeota bacterium]|nr:AAA family ATPase [Candidatus Dormibacteraeota bacterium]
MSLDPAGGASELIGRERELTVLETWLQRPTGARVIFIYGERGIGKTSVLRRGAALAAAEDRLVMVSRPARAEAGMRFAALGDILQGVAGEDLDALAAPQQSALRAVRLEVSENASQAGEADIRPVSLGMLALLKRLSAERPAVIAIDDMQWLDVGTTEVVQFALRRLDADPVLVLATYDTGVFGLEREAQLPLEDVEDVVSLQLPPLSDDEVARVLHRRSLEGWPRSLVREASLLAGGNPRLALELAPQPGRGGQDDRLALPRPLTRWVLARLSGVSEAAMETLQAAAFLRDPAVDLLEQIVGRAAAPGLEEAARAGLVEVVDGRVKYLRPAVPAALRQRLDAEARRSLHRRLAAAVPEPVERLHHLALAAVGPVARLASTLESTSREVGASGDVVRACELAELSASLTEPTNKEAVAQRRLLAGEWHVAVGDTLVAAESFSQLAEGLPPGRSERARLKRQLAWLELWIKGVTDSEQHLEQAISEIADPALSARLWCDLSYTRFVQGDLDGAAAHSARALEMSTQPDLIRRARALSAATSAAAGQAPWPEERALTEPAPDQTGWDEWPSIDLAARSRVYSDEPSLPRRLRSGGALEAGGARWLAWLAEAQHWQELWEEAATVADRGMALAGETGEWVAAIRLRHVTALIAAHRGRLELAREAAREGIDAAERSGLTPLVALNWAVIGYVEHQGGSSAAAVEAFEPLLCVDLPGPEPGLLRLFPNAVEALIHAGRIDRARHHLARLDECRAMMSVRWLTASAARCHGLMAAAVGELDYAERWLEQGLATEQVSPRRL